MVKEISARNGAEMDILQTMCVKEVWDVELQEKEAMLIREKDRALMEAVGEREKVPVMGKMRDTGRIVVKDSKTGESLEVARKVTFNPAIRARTVTVEGDVFELSGIVEGGSRRGGAPVLLLLAKANRVRGELDAKERELEASSRELSEMRKRAKKYRSAKSALELALHNLEVLEKAEGVAEEALVREEAKKKEEEVRELKRLLEEAYEEEKKGNKRLLELEAREKGVVMEACRVRVHDLAKASEECGNACEELRLECEEVCGECGSLRESIAKQEASVAEHGKRAEGLERRVREVKEEYEKVKREASEKKEEARRQSEALRGLEKALEACKSERVRVEGMLKQNGVKKAKLEKARSESVE